MCGIIGCLSNSDVAEILIEGLRKLEYRGYDSAGLALISGTDLSLVRKVGKLEVLAETIASENPPGTAGLGHTRWATHGKVSKENAHPHNDCTGRIVVVHNGIIENYSLLREQLLEDGHKFSSQTDSEILAHLIEKHYDGDLTTAVRSALAEVDGSYALAVIHAAHPDLILCARKDSPLVVGITPTDMYVASDITALLDRTREIVILEDGEIATISRGCLVVTDHEGNEIAKTAQQIDWDPVLIQKGGYRHFMLKEIDEQPAVVSNTILGRLDDENATVCFEDLPELEKSIDMIRGITILACGTSWHAGLASKFMIESLARIPVEVDYSSEFRYRDMLIGPGHLVIAISQSGETADTLAALRAAKAKGAHSLAICNVKSSTLCREVDNIILTQAGPEIGVASTKAFTTQMVALQLLSIYLGRKRGALSRDVAMELISGLRRLPNSLESVLKTQDLVDDLARKYWRADDFLFIGRGLNFPIALEGALKLKEISYIHAEGYPAGEMKHGPIALIDRYIPIVAVATQSRVYDKVVSNIEEARARDGEVIAIVNPGDDRVAGLADAIIEVPLVQEFLSPVINVVPLQYLAYHVARRRGCDIDQPRNLAKSVTVE
jgi:glutamine---fructose-6-phosphate transaminase (isomerizing)